MIRRNGSSMLKTREGDRAALATERWRKGVNVEMKGVEKKWMWVALGREKKNREGKKERNREFLWEASQFG